MGIFSSKEEKKNESNLDVDLVLDEGAREKYLQSLNKVSLLNFCQDHFQCDYSHQSGLSKAEFHELCDLFGISKAKRIGPKGSSITVQCKTNGFVKKNILFYFRDENEKYTVLVAEAEQNSGTNWKSLGLTTGAAGVASLLILAAINPIAGAVTFLASGVAIGGKYCYDNNNHEFQDLVLGHLITELEKKGDIEIKDGCCYLKCGDQRHAITNH